MYKDIFCVPNMNAKNTFMRVLSFIFFPRLFFIKGTQATLINLKQNHAEYKSECESARSIVNDRTKIFFISEFTQVE